MAERLIKKDETIILDDKMIYFVVVGKLALGKRIVVEQEFIFGKENRQATALRTTSLVSLTVQRQRC